MLLFIPGVGILRLLNITSALIGVLVTFPLIGLAGDVFNKTSSRVIKADLSNGEE